MYWYWNCDLNDLILCCRSEILRHCKKSPTIHSKLFTRNQLLHFHSFFSPWKIKKKVWMLDKNLWTYTVVALCSQNLSNIILWFIPCIKKVILQYKILYKYFNIWLDIFPYHIHYQLKFRKYKIIYLFFIVLKVFW